MNIGELMKAVQGVLEGNDADAAAPLAHKVTAITDMVGWATGPIDPQARLGEQLADLQRGLRTQYAGKADDAIAALHDALGELRDAIARHDLDLIGESDDDGNTVDM